ncbi:MAG: hypothetical protein ACTSYX_03175 [Candidatus Thorarchaeota archaeon]
MRNRSAKTVHISFRQLVDIPSTTYGVFGLYRYPAKFIPHVIAYILKHYGKPHMSVFDPFAGYGTVGTVARLYNLDYEMWDLNPILEVLHRVTLLKAPKIDPSAVVSEVRRSKEEYCPDWSNVAYWFHEQVLPVLKRAWGYYHSLQEEVERLLLTIPLLKVSRLFSYDDPGRMKLSKSPRSIARVEGILRRGVEREFYGHLSNEINSLVRRLRQYSDMSPRPVRSVVKAGIDTLTETLTETRDLLVTSPPYMQSQEYIRYAKMDLFWLGHPEEEIRRLAKLEIPYRTVPRVRINSPTFHILREKIDEEKMLRVYDNYFHAIIGFFDRIQKKIGCRMFIFVGRASMRGRPVPIDEIVAEHLVANGWRHEETLVDKISARRMFRYGKNPATQIEDARTPSERLVVLSR